MFHFCSWQMYLIIGLLWKKNIPLKLYCELEERLSCPQHKGIFIGSICVYVDRLSVVIKIFLNRGSLIYMCTWSIFPFFCGSGTAYLLLFLCTRYFGYFMFYVMSVCFFFCLVFIIGLYSVNCWSNFGSFDYSFTCFFCFCFLFLFLFLFFFVFAHGSSCYW